VSKDSSGFARIKRVGKSLQRRPAVLALVCGVAVMILASNAWISRTPADAGGPLALTNGAVGSVDELYRRVERAVSRPGFVLHQTESTKSRGLLGGETTEELWVDAARGVVREETYEVFRGSERRDRSIISGDVQYGDSPGSRIDASRCGGASAVASRVLGCHYDIDPETLRLSAGEWEGRAVLVLSQHGSHEGESSESYVEKLYVSPETYLPLAKEREGTADFGAPFRIKISSRTVYGQEFVATGTLAAGFFDPRSIGAIAQPNLGWLNRAGPVYWLGEHYAGRDGLPPLRLETIKPAKHHRGLVLQYGFTSGGDSSTVEVEQRGSPQPGFFAEPCTQERSLGVPAGQATLYSLYIWEHADPPTDTMGNPRCSRPPTDHAAIVRTDTSVVVISVVGAGRGKNPYRTLAGVEALARDLTPRTTPR